MMKIVFESVESQFTILNPQNNFAEESHRVELRKDPLLGDTSVYNPFLRDKAKAFFGQNDADLLRKLVEDTRQSCIFCPERVESVTPKYPSSIVPEGRIRRGEALLFPNLFSLGKYHPVVSLSRQHFLALTEFTPELIGNGLAAVRDFLRAAYRADQTVRFATVNANYLFPGGASLVHPHLQSLAGPEPYSYHARLAEACTSYHERNGSSYHADLVREEERGSRYIGRLGAWHWITPFSPLGSNEVCAVHDAESDFALLVDEDVHDLAAGISRVLRFYDRLGHLSFNYSLFSFRQPQSGEGQRLVLNIVNRQNVYPNYRNDDYFLQKMLQTELIINLPEDLAKGLREIF